MANTALRSTILKNAVTLVPSLGFTRAAIVQASMGGPGNQGLSDEAVDVLFGKGEEARKTLTRAWLEEGRNTMAMQVENHGKVTVRDCLKKRLEWNVPVLDKLPEAFALLATPSRPLPLLNVNSILEHPLQVAHAACRLSDANSTGTAWYMKRAALGSIYAASELHQLVSPTTAFRFLDGLLDASDRVSNATEDAATFTNYIGRSWLAIARSKGLI